MKSSAKNNGSLPPAPEYCTAAQSPVPTSPFSKTSCTEMASPGTLTSLNPSVNASPTYKNPSL